MKLLKYIILFLILLNIPAASLKFFGPVISTILSYGSFLLLLLYYAGERNKTSFNWWMIIIGLLYYIISSFQYTGETDFFITTSAKYFLIIITGYELIKKVNSEELYWFLLFGSLSIVIEAMFFPSKFGRYSGLYLNPNTAGFICISGYSLTYALKKSSLKLIGQFIFTLMGILTFSRTFIVIWLLVNIISLKISFKNIRIFGIGFVIFSTLILIDEAVGLNNPRFQQLKAIFNNENVSTTELNEDSRTETWALFYDKILDSPIIGSGYGKLSGIYQGHLGAHNTYLMIIGEAGIFPFLFFISLFIYFVFWSTKLFKYAPNLLMQTIALSVFLLANHNYFNFYYITFLSMYIQYQIEKTKINNYGFNTINYD